MWEISPLSDVGIVKIFSNSVGFLFVLLTVSFALQKCFNFRKSHLFIIALSICAASVIVRKWSPVPIHWRIIPTFSCTSFSVVRFILRSLIHFYLSFVHGNSHGSVFILLRVDIQLCKHPLLKMLSFFHCIILVSLTKITCS